MTLRTQTSIQYVTITDELWDIYYDYFRRNGCIMTKLNCITKFLTYNISPKQSISHPDYLSYGPFIVNILEAMDCHMIWLHSQYVWDVPTSSQATFLLRISKHPQTDMMPPHDPQWLYLHKNSTLSGSTSTAPSTQAIQWQNILLYTH